MLSVVPRAVVVRVPAKINLHLGVGDLRADGYHDLLTVFHAVSLTDVVRLAPAEELTVSVRGDGAAGVPADASNLAAQAAVMLARRAGIEPAVHIEIEKGIPVAGGMAGGSADAAAALLGLTRLWRLDVERSELMSIAAELGSDVPFSLQGGTAVGHGRGERLTPALSRGELHWVIAASREGLSTPAVYRELDRLRAERGSGPVELEPPDALLSALAAGDPERVAAAMRNDLQPAAISLRPALRRTLRAGIDAGALTGIVSGSGPTCVFICSDASHAIGVAAELSGAGVASAVRTASGPVAGARVDND